MILNFNFFWSAKDMELYYASDLRSNNHPKISKNLNLESMISLQYSEPLYMYTALKSWRHLIKLHFIKVGVLFYFSQAI